MDFERFDYNTSQVLSKAKHSVVEGSSEIR